MLASVTTPEEMSFSIEHPMPGPHHAALLASYRLLLGQAVDAMRVQVRQRDPGSFLESWEVARAALLARMAGTLRHLGYLAPSFSRIDGIALSRTLADHAITFAWMSGDPAERLQRFLRSSHYSLLRKDGRAVERGEDALLDVNVRAQFEAKVASGPKMPDLWQRAEQADASWSERVKTNAPASIQITDFRGLYNKVYANYSEYDHPSTIGLGIFVHRDVDGQVVIVDGQPERDLESDLRPYWLAVFAFADALVVSSLASSKPGLAQLRRALETIGTLRMADREGRLRVTTSDGLTTIGIDEPEVSPDDDAG
jgi:hypothetical protein